MDQRMLAKRTSNALERLEQIEKTIPQIVSAVNQSLGQVSGQLSSAVEVLDAVVQALGAETIEKAIVESRRKKAEENSAAEKKALEDLVTQGAVALAEKVSEKSIIVGQETDKDGAIRHPGRAQVAFQRVDPQFQAGLLGQVTGFALDLPNGGKFTIQEVYEVVTPKADAAPAADATNAAVEPVAAPPTDSKA